MALWGFREFQGVLGSFIGSFRSLKSIQSSSGFRGSQDDSEASQGVSGDFMEVPVSFRGVLRGLRKTQEVSGTFQLISGALGGLRGVLYQGQTCGIRSMIQVIKRIIRYLD